MTARPEDQPLPLDEGHDEKAGRPPRDSADDGKHGGQSQGGRPGTSGIEQKSGIGTERDAPGLSTDKRADDTK